MDFLSIVYLVIGCFVAYLLFNQVKVVKCYAQWITGLRVLILVMAIFMFVFALFSQTTLEIIRNIGCAFVCLLFAALNDGIGESGIYSNGNFISFASINGYDLQEKDKSYNLVISFNTQEKKGGVSNHTVTLRFSLKNKDKVKQLIESKIKRKYRRMK